jgi:hypothetical protein
MTREIELDGEIWGHCGATEVAQGEVAASATTSAPLPLPAHWAPWAPLPLAVSTYWALLPVSNFAEDFALSNVLVSLQEGNAPPVLLGDCDFGTPPAHAPPEVRPQPSARAARSHRPRAAMSTVPFRRPAAIHIGKGRRAAMGRR